MCPHTRGIAIDDILDRAHVVALPMRVRFRGVTVREALLIDGPQAFGEFSPFVEYGDEEAVAWLRAGLEAAYEGFPAPVRERVAVNATVPAVPPAQVAQVLEGFPGCRVVKVKVAEKGQSLSDDIARVAAVRELIAGALIRVDANGGWSVEQAVAAARELGPLDYLEQPCASAEELAQLRVELMRAGLFVRVAADESIRRAADPFRVAQLRAADVAVLKVAPLGGVARTLEIAGRLRENFMDVTIASALDTAVGLNAGLAAVAALPRIADDDLMDVPPAAAGLGTGSLFWEDVAPPRPIIDGYLDPSPLNPTAERLSELAAPASRREWWFQRLRRVHALL